MFEIATIPYKETIGFISVRDERTGAVFALPKTICDSFGIEWAGQQQKLAANPQRWEYEMVSIVLPGDDRTRQVAVIPDRKVRTWICGINPEKVKPEVRPRLEAFQDECDNVLYEYWTKGVAVNPRYQLAASEEMKQFVGDVVGTAVERALSQVSTSLVETTVRATVAAIREENKRMMSDTVRATLAEIRSEDPVYLAARKWDVVERMHRVSRLPQEQIEASQQAVLGMLLPGIQGKTLADMGLTHASDFLHAKSLQGYRWGYKTLESAATQLTKAAKRIWEKDSYQAFQESVTLQSGRTVQAYVFPALYAEQAFEEMRGLGKFYREGDEHEQAK